VQRVPDKWTISLNHLMSCHFPHSTNPQGYDTFYVPVSIICKCWEHHMWTEIIANAHTKNLLVHHPQSKLRILAKYFINICFKVSIWLWFVANLHNIYYIIWNFFIQIWYGLPLAWPGSTWEVWSQRHLLFQRYHCFLKKRL